MGFCQLFTIKYSKFSTFHYKFNLFRQFFSSSCRKKADTAAPSYPLFHGQRRRGQQGRAPSRFQSRQRLAGNMEPEKAGRDYFKLLQIHDFVHDHDRPAAGKSSFYRAGGRGHPALCRETFS